MDYALMNPERPRGLLNERERRYFLGTSDIEPKSADERQLRQQVRERLLHAMIDFGLLHSELEDRDQTRIWNDGDDSMADGTTTRAVVPSMVPAVAAFLYKFYFLHYSGEQLSQVFAKRLEQGIEDVYEATGRSADADVSIEVDLGDEVAQILERLEQGGARAITRQELNMLYRHDEIDDAAYTQLSLEMDGA